MSMEIGEKIRRRREELGMTQDELAHKIGYTSRTAIQKIEKGKNNLRQTKIKQLAEVLQVDPTYIMGWQTSDFIVDSDGERRDFLIELSKCPSDMLERVMTYYDLLVNAEKGKKK